MIVSQLPAAGVVEFASSLVKNLSQWRDLATTNIINKIESFQKEEAAIFYRDLFPKKPSAGQSIKATLIESKRDNRRHHRFDPLGSAQGVNATKQRI